MALQAAMHAIDIEKVMTNVDGDSELLLEIFETFDSEAPETLSSLEESIAKNESENAGRFAHTLKGIAWGVGAERLRELCLVAEQAGKSGDLLKVKEQVPEIENELKQVLEEIKNYINRE